MSSEELLIEMVSDRGTDNTDGQTVVRAVDASAIADNLNKLISLVHQLDLTSSGGLELDEVAITAKISATGEVILLNGNPGSGNAAIVLKFKRSIAQGRSPAISSASLSLQEEFRSAVGIDYTKLNTLLAEGNWQKANQETWDLMCEALSKNKGSYLSEAEIKQLPCEDIRTIDQLWQKHSQGRFGFTSQHQAYKAAMTEK